MKRRILEVFLVFLAGGIFIYSGVSATGKEGTFEIKRIEVVGGPGDAFRVLYGRDLRRITGEEVLALVSSDPFVGHVDVEKIYPHTLLVRVYRKKPFACMLKGKKQILVDRKGKSIKEGCSGVNIYFKASEVPLDLQMGFMERNARALEKFSWVKVSSPFFVEGQIRGRKWRVLLPLKEFAQRLAFLEEVLPLLDGEENFSLADLRTEGKLYLR